MSPRVGLDLQTVLVTASIIADKKGLESVTLASLAKELNVKSPSLYNHIEGLPDLRKKLTIFGLEKLYKAMSEATKGCSGDEAIRRISYAYISFARQHPGLYEASVITLDPIDKEIEAAGKSIVDLTLHVLQVYNLDEAELLHILRGFRSILHGFSSLEQKGGFGMNLDIEESLQLLINTFIAGVHSLANKSND